MQGMLSFPCVREVAAALNVGVRALRRLEPHLGAVAQWSEQGTHNPWVVGSIPTSPTNTAGRRGFWVRICFCPPARTRTDAKGRQDGPTSTRREIACRGTGLCGGGCVVGSVM